MARKLRVEYAGAIYHVLNRGNRKEPIFKDKVDYELFLKTLGETCGKTGWQVHAWCLMKNHFHLVVETPQPNLVAGMKWLLGTFTSRFNWRHKVTGHLFAGRYKAILVDGSGNGYFRTVCDYVHLNPTRAKLLKPEQPLRSYQWSSLTEYLKEPGERPGWLNVQRLFGEAGIPKDSMAGRRHFEKGLESRREEKADWEQVRSGWFIGDESFKKELMERMTGHFGEYHSGEARHQCEEHHALQIIKEELVKIGWNEADLQTRSKGDINKIKIALRLRLETTVTLKWIAHQLNMGATAYLNRRLYEQRNKERLTGEQTGIESGLGAEDRD